MPLIVTPVRSLTAYCISGTYLSMTQQFGPLYYWVFRKIAIDSDTGEVNSSVPGYIHTDKAALLPRDHNCDHLQLSGSAVDLSLLTDWTRRPTPAFKRYSGIPYITFLRNTMNGVVADTPATIFVEGGQDSIVMYTPKNQSGSMRWIVVSESSYTFGHIVDGIYIDPNRTGTSSDYVVFAAFHVEYTTTYGARCQSNQLIISMTNKKYDDETIRSHIIPAARTYLKTTFWYYRSYQGARMYTSSVSILDPNRFRDVYTFRDREWLSILEKKTRIDRSFGELHYRTLSKIDGFSGNGFAYARDIKNLLTELKDIAKLLKGNVTPKSLSSLYLSWRYGVRLTVSDTKELTQALKHMRGNSGVSATENVTIDGLYVKRVTTIRYSKHDTIYEKIYHFLRYLDLLPSADNIWDLIPYSFVLDWFLNIGNLADQYDKLELISHLDIHAVYDSYKLSYQGPASLVGPELVGNVTVTRYNRHCHTDASFPLIVSNSRSTVTHWVDGLALIIQRLVK